MTPTWTAPDRHTREVPPMSSPMRFALASESKLYFSKRDRWDFEADGLVGLLGVVSIFEARPPSEYSEYWWRRETERGLINSIENSPRTCASEQKRHMP